MGTKTKLNNRHRIFNINNNRHYKTSKLIKLSIKFPKTSPSRNCNSIFQEGKLANFITSSQSLKIEMTFPSIMTKTTHFSCHKLSFRTSWKCWDNRQKRCLKISTKWMKTIDILRRNLSIYTITSFWTRAFSSKERQKLISISLINSNYTSTSSSIISSNNNKSKTFKISWESKTRTCPFRNCTMNLKSSYYKLTKFLPGILTNRYNKYLLEFQMIFNCHRVSMNWLIFKITIFNNSKEKTLSNNSHKLFFKVFKIRLYQAKINISLTTVKTFTISLSKKIWLKWTNIKVKKESIMLSYNNKYYVIMKKSKTSHKHPVLMIQKNKLKMKKNEIKISGDS